MKGNRQWLRAVLAVLFAATLSFVFTVPSFADYYPPGRPAVTLHNPYSTGYPSSCIRSLYFVRPGDNLFRIGLRFGVSPLRLAFFNGLRNPNLIFAGMRLAIPCSRASAPGYSPYVMPGSSPYAMPGYSPYRVPGYSSYMMPGYMPNPMSGYPPAPSPSPVPGQGMVVMRNIAFSPATITIHVGQRVVWRNDDSAPHTTTSGSCSGNVCTPMPGWDSGTLNQGQSFSHTFNAAGTFTYYCRIHGAMMQGSVVVMP